MSTPALRARPALVAAAALLLGACDADRVTAPVTSVEPAPPAPSLSVTGSTVTAPTLPLATVDVRPVAPTGRTITVSAGGNLQNAINAAVPGDVVVLAAGATFSGNFYLPKKTGTGWVTIRTSTSDA